MKKNRLAATVAVALAIIAAIIWVPLPYSVKCAVEVQPQDGSHVYAVVPGVLSEVRVRPGTRVEKGDLIATLQNEDLLMRVNELRQAAEQYRAQIDLFKYQRDVRQNADVSGRIPEYEELLISAEKQLKQQLDDLEHLQVKASSAGIVMVPPPRKVPPNPDGQLPQWSGDLLDPRNRGAFLQPNDEICVIGDPKKFEAVMAVDQADLAFLAPGQLVRIKLDALTNEVIETSIENHDDIAREPMRYSPQSMSVQAGGTLATRTDASGGSRPLSATYQVTVPLVGEDGWFKIGQRGRARISATPQSLGQRFWRFATRTFHFEI